MNRPNGTIADAVFKVLDAFWRARCAESPGERGSVDYAYFRVREAADHWLKERHAEIDARRVRG